MYAALPSLSGAPHAPPTIVDACPAGESGLRSCAVDRERPGEEQGESRHPGLPDHRSSFIGRCASCAAADGKHIESARPCVNTRAHWFWLRLSRRWRFRPSALPGDDRLAYALTGGRVIVAPGKVIDSGRRRHARRHHRGGGPAASTAIPSDARTIDVSGKVVHAAFLDPYVSVDRLAGKGPKKPTDDEESESERAPALQNVGPAGHPVGAVRAEQRVIDGLIVKDDVADAYRRLGFAVVAAVPTTGVLRGPRRRRQPRRRARHWPRRRCRKARKSSRSLGLHDASSIRAPPWARSPSRAQAFLDALWWRDAEAAYAAKPPGMRGRAVRRGTAALVPAAEGKETVVFDAPDVLGAAARGARRAGVQAQGRLRRVGRRVPSPKEVAAGTAGPGPARELSPARQARQRRPSGWTCPDRASARVRPRAVESEVDAGRGTDVLVYDGRPRRRQDVHPPARAGGAGARSLARRRAGRGDDRSGTPAGSPGPAGHRRGRKDREPRGRDGEPFAEKSRVAEIWIDGKRIESRRRREERGEASYAARGQRARPPTCARPRPARPGPVAAPNAVVVRGATVWTQRPRRNPRGRRRPGRPAARSPAVGKGLDGARRRRWRSTARASTSRRASSTRTRTSRSTTASTRARTTSPPRCGSTTSSIRPTAQSTASSPAA